MNYVITGGAGNISKPLAQRLLRAGHNVTVIGRSEDHLGELSQSGAQTAIGTLEDLEFLKKAFAGADAVYTMCPPNFVTGDLEGFCERLATNYVEAIRANNIRYAVNLSSVGAHLPRGGGHVSAMRRAELVLDTLNSVHIKHLRPVYFYTNLMANIGMIKEVGIIGGNFSIAAKKFPMVAPADIAAVAAEELLALNFSGHTKRYIASEETGTDEIASVLGAAIGNPDLKWMKFSDEQAFESMLQAGFPQSLAGKFVEGFNALHEGRLTEDYWSHRPSQLGVTLLEDFAKEFAAAYNANQ